MKNNNTYTLPTGTVLYGRVYTYTIDRVLGQGAFGITYLASTRMTGPLGKVTVPVALKEFFAKELDSRQDDGTVTARTEEGVAQKYAKAFKRESENLSKMEHPGIVNVLEAFEAKGTYYYAMEFLSGGSLDDKVKGKGLSEEEALSLIKKIGEALAYMHDRKVMHLDLKPKNIMLKGDGTPVIIDFGLSKQYDSAGEPESSSTIGLGTPGYAPIEQATQTSSGEFQPTLDIYALGATLYKMLTGETPPAATMILNKKATLDAELQEKSVSETTIIAIRKAMAPLMDDRPQGVAEFLALLVSDEITQVGEPAAKPQTDPAPTPAPRPMPAPASAPAPAPAPEPASPADGSKTKSLLWVLLGGLMVVGILLGIIFGGKKKQPDNPVVQTDSTEVVAPTQTELAPEAQPEQAAPGSVKVSSTPAGATIWLDGKNTKKTTPEILEDLAPGKHTIKLVLEDYNDYSGSVTITSGKRSDLSKTLTTKEKPSQQTEAPSQSQTQPEQTTPGSIKVSSTPAGATIWLDGKNTKKITPDILEDLTPGVHTIKMVLEGYNDYSGSVTITSGKRSNLSKTLTTKEKSSQQTQTQTQTLSQTNQNTQPQTSTTSSQSENEVNIQGGESMSVRRFYLDETNSDVASGDIKQYDRNGELCALIKLKTPLDGFTFDVGSLGVTGIKRVNRELWIYVPWGVRKISISHPRLGEIKDYFFPVIIEKGHTYIMELEIK